MHKEGYRDVVGARLKYTLQFVKDRIQKAIQKGEDATFLMKAHAKLLEEERSGLQSSYTAEEDENEKERLLDSLINTLEEEQRVLMKIIPEEHQLAEREDFEKTDEEKALVTCKKRITKFRSEKGEKVYRSQGTADEKRGYLSRLMIIYKERNQIIKKEVESAEEPRNKVSDKKKAKLREQLNEVADNIVSVYKRQADDCETRIRTATSNEEKQEMSAKLKEKLRRAIKVIEKQLSRADADAAVSDAKRNELRENKDNFASRIARIG